jgi:TonB-linked SusC/RagA family outer membrane protein
MLVPRVIRAKTRLCLYYLTSAVLTGSLAVASSNSYASSWEAVGQLKAAEVVVTGTVVDNTGEPLPGVTILIQGTTIGTATDLEGRYSLQVPEGATLTFSFIGFQPQTIVLGGRTVINVVLLEDTAALDEVVVVGYGTQRKSDLTGAISSVSSEDLRATPAGNFLEQSQGKLAGVDIVRANGSPGAPVQIRIRGNRSINASNEPLYVIDGIPTTANISDFNPNDIESMEVLKDASAVAIYGSRGANGVVLITTKRGKTGKAVISYDGYYGIKNPVENINLMDGSQFAQYARVSRGYAADDASHDDEFLSGLELDNLREGRFTDWLDLAIQRGSQQEHQVSVSGGAEKINYYVSGSFFQEEGYIPGTDFSRHAVRINLESQLTDRLKLGLSSSVSISERNQMSNLPYSNSLGYSPLVGPTDDQGNFLPFPNPREGLLANPLINYQPYQYVDETKSHRIFANIFAEYQFTESLKFRVNYGPDFNIGRRGTYTGLLEGNINKGSVNNQMDFAHTLENILSYDKDFGKHHVNVVGLYSVQASRFETSLLSGQNIPVEKSLYYDLGSSSTITGIGSSLGEWGLLSYMGRINYRYNDKFLLTLTGRADGSSRLAEGNKWAFFPAVSAGYILSEEAFMQASAISFLKVRAGYGEVGNTAISPYQTMGGLSRSTYIFGTSPAFGFENSMVPNPDLKWEISKTTNVGLDFGFFDDRFSGSIEYYVTNTKDLLLNRLLPTTSGYSSILQNIGATKNNGWEAAVSGNILKRPGGFNWDVSLNVYANREQIVELFDGESDDVGNQWFIGHPIHVFYNFQQEGIWQSHEADQAAANGQQPGDIKIRDVNGRNQDGNLSKEPNGVINADDRTILGSTVPDWSGGLTNQVSFRGFDLSVLVHARIGQMIRSDFHNLGGNNWQGRYNSLNLDYWTPDNPSNAFPRPDAGEAPLFADAVRFFDGSYVKIRNVALGYNLPSSALEKIGLSSARIYSTMNNAFIFSPYKVVDPETANGIVGGSTPLTTATYILGVNLKF